MNVGPTARGTFDHRADHALEEMGKWMKYNNRSIYGCTQAPDIFNKPDNTLLTYNPETNRLYVHLLDYPMKNFILKGFADKVQSAQFLHDASEIKIGKLHGYGAREEISGNDINLLLPVNKPNIEVPVIELFLK